MSRRIYALALTVVLSGCGFYHVNKEKPQNGFRDLGKGTLDFQTVKTAVLQDYCLTCHSQAKATAKKPALETYAQVFALRQSIHDDVVDGSMPDDGPLPEHETQILMAWLAAGAPEFSDLPLPGQTPADPQPAPMPQPNPTPVPEPLPQPTPGPLPGPEAVTFETLQSQLFQPLCIECHGGFANYEKVVKRIDEIHASIVNNEMPKDASPVSAELKAKLEKWIAAGLPEK